MTNNYLTNQSSSSAVFDPGDSIAFIDTWSWEDPDIPFGGSEDDWKIYHQQLRHCVSEFFELLDTFDWTGYDLWFEMANYFRPDALKLMEQSTLVSIINAMLSRNVNIDFENHSSLADAYITSMIKTKYKEAHCSCLPQSYFQQTVASSTVVPANTGAVTMANQDTSQKQADYKTDFTDPLKRTNHNLFNCALYHQLGAGDNCEDQPKRLHEAYLNIFSLTESYISNLTRLSFDPGGKLYRPIDFDIPLAFHSELSFIEHVLHQTINFQVKRIQHISRYKNNHYGQQSAYSPIFKIYIFDYGETLIPILLTISIYSILFWIFATYVFDPGGNLFITDSCNIYFIFQLFQK